MDTEIINTTQRWVSQDFMLKLKHLNHANEKSNI